MVLNQLCWLSVPLSFSHPSLSDLRLARNLIAMAGHGEVWKVSSSNLYFTPVSSGRRINHRQSWLQVPVAQVSGYKTGKDKHLLKHCKIEAEQQEGMEILS